MASLLVQLPDSTLQFLEEQASCQGCQSPAQYLAALAGQAEAERDAIELELAKGLEGPARKMTKEDWNELRQRVWERHEAKPVP